MKPPLFIFCHQGVGDHFITNGLVRTLALDGPVLIPCWAEYYETVRFMFSDTAICVIPTAKEKDDTATHDLCRQMEKGGCRIMKLGYMGGDPTFTHEYFFRHFYRQAGVPFEKMFDAWFVPPVPDSLAVPYPTTPFAFVHEYESPGRRLLLDRARISLPLFIVDNNTRPQNFLALIPALQHAAEIHCIPSGINVLVDFLGDTVKGKKFLHTYARPDANLHGIPLREGWTIL